MLMLTNQPLQKLCNSSESVTTKRSPDIETTIGRTGAIYKQEMEKRCKASTFDTSFSMTMTSLRHI